MFTGEANATATFQKGQKINPLQDCQHCVTFWKNYGLSRLGAHFQACEIKQVPGSHQHRFTKSKLCLTNMVVSYDNDHICEYRTIMHVFCIDSSEILALSSMIFTLECSHLHGQTSEWIKYGPQKVIYRSYFTWVPVTDELPEASALGPVLFNISTNDEQEVTENTSILQIMSNQGYTSRTGPKKAGHQEHYETAETNIQKLFLLQVKKQLLQEHKTMWRWRGRELALLQRHWGGDGHQDGQQAMVFAGRKGSQDSPGLVGTVAQPVSRGNCYVMLLR